MVRQVSTCVGLVAALAATGCSGGGEQQILQKYFQAAKLGDRTTLSNIATVRFNPEVDGIVQSFSVNSVTPEQTRTLPLRQLRKAQDDAVAASDDFSKKMKDYQKANEEAIDRVLQAERKNASVSGKDAAVQVAWRKWRDDMQTHSKQLANARSQLSRERSIAEVSVYDARNPVEVTAYDVAIVSKDVNITADVRKGGASSSKNLIVRMERAIMKKDNAPDKGGRWIITSIRDAASGAPTS